MKTIFKMSLLACGILTSASMALAQVTTPGAAVKECKSVAQRLTYFRRTIKKYDDVAKTQFLSPNSRAHKLVAGRHRMDFVARTFIGGRCCAWSSKYHHRNDG